MFITYCLKTTYIKSSNFIGQFYIQSTDVQKNNLLIYEKFYSTLILTTYIPKIRALVIS